jgi:hypothetical protein
MYTKTKKRVFISFHMDDLHAKTLLQAQAKDDRFDLEFINYSVNEPFDEKWKTQCKTRIAQCDIVICMIGQNTHSRPAVIWELNTAYSLNKKVFGIRISKNRWDNIPSPLIYNGATITNWDIVEINSEIKKRI